ncbi:hypothetical protein CYY_009532 [Polysphondylium violaceum]|uniref:FNIP repeat-containing protein n=1 Tax=Polysphondylium violaceum TaxID=133409 RepID=A0A8J4PTI1_9MYCE|nr:hypothetical protein CYY_009532 [Polysphondylium violaceum]
MYSKDNTGPRNDVATGSRINRKELALNVFQKIILNNNTLVPTNDKSFRDRVGKWSIKKEFRCFSNTEYGIVVLDLFAPDLVSLLSSHDGGQICKHINLTLALNRDYSVQYDNSIIEIISLLKDSIRSIRIKVYDNITAVQVQGETCISNLFNRVRDIIEKTTLDLLESYSDVEIVKEIFEIQDSDVRVEKSVKIGSGDVSIPSDTFHVVWNREEAPARGFIPDGVKRVTFSNPLQQPVGDALPESVGYVKVHDFNGCLSEIKFPSALKYLKFAGEFGAFVFRNADIPTGVTHLEFGVTKNIAYHWLTYKGTLPRNITHLKITDGKEYVKHRLAHPFLVPSSVQCIDINISLFNTLNIKMIDEKDYYCDADLSRESFTCFDANAIEMSPDYPLSITAASFSRHLQSLDVANYKKPFNANDLPPSLTSLVCLSTEQIPDHAQLCYLKYKISESIHPTVNTYELVFKSDERAITKPSIPAKVDSLTGSFTPKPAIPIAELTTPLNNYYAALVIPRNAVYKKVVARLPIQLPEFVEVYESSLHLPLNYPKSLHTVILTERLPFTLKYIPATVKHLYCCLDQDLMSSISTPIEDKYSFSNSNRSNNNNIIVSIDTFFKIWRNNYLVNNIKRFKVQPRFVKFQWTRTKGQTTHQFSEQEDIDYYAGSTTCLKLKVNEISTIPHGVTNHAIFQMLSADKQHLLLQLPRSIYKLKIYCSSLKKDVLPPNVKHLVLRVAEIKSSFHIPPTVEILELKLYDVKFEALKKWIPATVKRVAVTFASFEIDCFKHDTLALYNSRSLFGKGQVYEIYNGQEPIPISPTTTVLFWTSNTLILPGTIPMGVKRIVFGDSFNQAIMPGTIPSSVTEINFGQNFNQSFSLVHLPVSLKYLSLVRYKQPLQPHTLPPCLVQFKIQEDYQYYTTLIHLPKSIKYAKVRGVKLIQDHDNNDSTTSIQFKSIYSNLENSRQEAIISDINESSVEYQDGSRSRMESLSLNNPETEIHLSIDQNIAIASGTLDHLNIKSMVFKKDYNQSLPKGSIPNSVTSLVFAKGCSFMQQLICVPPSLCVLNLSHIYQSLTPIEFPLSLTELHLPAKFTQPIKKGNLPMGLKQLYVSQYFVQTLESDMIPETVQHLSLYEPKVVSKIPPTVQELSIYNSISLATIPKSITKLNFYDNAYLGNMDQLPCSIRSLSLPSTLFSGRIPPTVNHIEIKNYNRYLSIAK